MAYLATNPQTLKVLSRFVGRWEQAFYSVGIPARLVMPEAWQRNVLAGLMIGGAKRDARKRAARLWVRSSFGLVMGENEADAVGLAIHVLRDEAFAALAAG